MAILQISDALLEKLETVVAHHGVTIDEWLQNQLKPYQLGQPFYIEKQFFTVTSDDVISPDDVVTRTDELEQTLASASAYSWSAIIDENGMGRYTYFSPDVENVTGYPPEFYLEGMTNWLNTIHPDDRPKINYNLPNILSPSAKQHYHDYRIIKPDMSVCWVGAQITVTPLKNGSIRLDGVVSDITQYKEKLIELEQIQARFRSLVENTTDAIFCFEYDPPIPINLPIDDQIQRLYEGVLAECNARAAQFYGVQNADDAVGQRLTAIFGTTEGSLDGFLREFIQNDYAVANLEAEEILANGSRRFFSNSGYAEIHSNHIYRVWGSFREVTEIKQFSTKLDRSESRWRSLVENVPNILFEFDEQGIIQFINFTSIGQEPEDMVGTSLYDYTPPDDRDRVQEIIKQVIATGQAVSYEAQGIDGTWYTIRVGPIKEQDRVVRLLMLLTDITEHKQTEEALRKSDAQYRALFFGSQNPILVYDENATIVMLNNQAATNLGVSHSEAVGKPLTEFLPESHEDAISRIRHVLTTQKPSFTEDFAELKSGNRWFWTILQPVVDMPQIVQSISYDITERKQSEEETRRSKYLLDQAERIAQMGSFERDVIQQKTLWSSGLKQLYGIDYDDNPETFLELVHPDDRAQVAKRFTEAYRGDITSTKLEYRVRLQDGTIRHHQATTEPFYDENNNLIRTIGYIQDITERKQAEQLEVERARLALMLEQEHETAQLRSKLISIISHEFRTPLTIILASSEMLAKYQDKLSPEKQQQKIASIGQQVTYLEEMLDEITILMQANRGFLDYQPALVDIEALCQQVIEHMQIAAANMHTLKLVLNTSDTQAVLDQKLMIHALTNLISNAIKYSPEGGAIYLQVDQIDQNWVFSVIDSGIGIPTSDHANLWEPFNRASNVNNIRGSGLGLSIVKEVAKHHQGTVKVESALGQGSTFKIIIPNNLQEY